MPISDVWPLSGLHDLPVALHYRENSFRPPFDHKSSSKAARLLKAQSKVQKDPDRQEPLPPKALAKMCELAKVAGHLEFRAAIWDGTGLGHLGVFCQQEHAMDKSMQWTQKQTQNTI